MPRQFDNDTCVLCLKRPSTPPGEHVLPRWLLKLFPPKEGPYTVELNQNLFSTVTVHPNNRTRLAPRRYPRVNPATAFLRSVSKDPRSSSSDRWSPETETSSSQQERRKQWASGSSRPGSWWHTPKRAPRTPR